MTAEVFSPQRRQHLPGSRLHGTSRDSAAVDLDGTQSTRAVRMKLGMPAQVGNVVSAPAGRLHDGLAVQKVDVLAIEGERGVGRLDICFAHGVSLRCAAGSSRPVMRRATDSSASRSKPGSKCSDFRRRS